MKKLAWLSTIVVAALLAYVAAGPFLTINAIRDAVQAEDSRALSKQVDFPGLRQSLRLQLSDMLVREAGGRCLDFRGGGDSLHSGQIVAGNLRMSELVQKRIVDSGYASAFDSRLSEATAAPAQGN